MIRKLLIRLLRFLLKPELLEERQREAYRLARLMFVKSHGYTEESDRSNKHSPWWYAGKKYKESAREFYGLPLRGESKDFMKDYDEHREEEKTKRLK